MAAFVMCAPVAVPAGLLAASLLWAWRIYAIETGLSGRTATAPVVFDARQWRRQAAAARDRATAPGSVPLTDVRGRIVAGPVIHAVGHRLPVIGDELDDLMPRLAAGPYQAVDLQILCNRPDHQVIIRAVFTLSTPETIIKLIEDSETPDAPLPPALVQALTVAREHMSDSARHPYD